MSQIPPLVKVMLELGLEKGYLILDTSKDQIANSQKRVDEGFLELEAINSLNLTIVFGDSEARFIKRFDRFTIAHAGRLRLVGGGDRSFNPLLQRVRTDWEHRHDRDDGKPLVFFYTRGYSVDRAILNHQGLNVIWVADIATDYHLPMETKRVLLSDRDEPRYYNERATLVDPLTMRVDDETDPLKKAALRLAKIIKDNNR